MAKEGSTIGGLMDSFGTAISMSLQYGVPLEVLVNKFSHTRFDPMGFTKNSDIRYAKSLVDYIFRWLGCQFLPGFREANLGIPPKKATEGDKAGDGETAISPVATKADGQKQGHGVTEKNKTSASAPSSVNENGTVNTNGHHSKTSLISGDKIKTIESESSEAAVSMQFSSFDLDAPSCDNCGSITVRNGNCHLCHNCGNSMGCS
jgi:ribonucleoside-diphosphate reductase alpha chain